MRYQSPLRYPGGKARFAGLLAEVIERNDLAGCSYYEPYAGGAGAALRLISEQHVREVHLNDADFNVYAFWKAVLSETEHFAEEVMKAELTIAEWHEQHAILENPSGHSVFDVGFATFYMNRCNRSGVLLGSGPIGGYRQTGDWNLGSRFNREGLAKRVASLKTYKDRIQLYNMDALAFLKRNLPRRCRGESVFVYLDPPYYVNGNRLYLDYYSEREHRKLARYMLQQKQLKWIMSYDKANFVALLYRTCRLSTIDVTYSLQKHGANRELLISPHHLNMPSSRYPSAGRMRIRKTALGRRQRCPHVRTKAS